MSQGRVDKRPSNPDPTPIKHAPRRPRSPPGVHACVRACVAAPCACALRRPPSSGPAQRGGAAVSRAGGKVYCCRGGYAAVGRRWCLGCKRKRQKQTCVAELMHTPSCCLPAAVEASGAAPTELLSPLGLKPSLARVVVRCCQAAVPFQGIHPPSLPCPRAHCCTSHACR